MKLETASGETGSQDQDLFALNLINNKEELEALDSKDTPDNYQEDSGSELEFEDDEDDKSSVDSSDEEYVYGDDELYEKPDKKKQIDPDQPKQKKRKKSIRNENPLLVDGEDEEKDEEVAAVNKAKQWYQKDVFKGIEDKEEELEDDYDIEQMLSNFKKKGGVVIEKENPEEDEEDIEDEVKESDTNGDNVDATAIVADATAIVADDTAIVADDGDDSKVDGDTSDDESEDEIDDRSISVGKVKSEQNKQLKQQQNDAKVDSQDAPKKVDLDAEDLALGAAIATSKKRKRDIVDGAYNRYSFNDDNLPAWFTEDENKHTHRHIPITREEVEFYKQRMRDLNARPIKKVIEAKAKKKSKMMHKLEKVRSRAQGILDADETSTKEKQSQIKGIYKKAGLVKKETAKPTFVVAKKGLAGKNYKRPSSVKGTYKVVDPRMKKDLKAMKGKEKTKGRRKK